MTINRTTLNTGLGLGVLALAIGAWLLLRDGGHQTTNNAYVVADYTLVAPKIPGFVSADGCRNSDHRRKLQCARGCKILAP